MLLIALILALAFATVADTLDDRITQKGIDAGLAVEGNTYIDKIFHTNKPTLAQRLLVNFAIIVGLTILGMCLLPAGFLVFAPIAGLIVTGIKHMNGWRDWQKLFSKVKK